MGSIDSRFFSTVSRFPPCPHPPHQSTAPRLSPLPLISAPTSPLGTSGPQLCERLRCRERSRGGGEWGLLMGLAEAIEDVFGVEDGGAVVRWIYRQPHRSEWRGVGIRVKVGQGDGEWGFVKGVGGGGGLKGVEGGVAAGAGGGHSSAPSFSTQTHRHTPQRAHRSALPGAIPSLPHTLSLRLSLPTPPSYDAPVPPTPSPHLLLPRHLLPHGLPHTHGTGALLTQEEVAAMAELHGRLQAKLGEAWLLGSPWRFLRMAGQREEEAKLVGGAAGSPVAVFRSDEQREEEVRSGWVTPPSAPCPLATCSSEGEGEWAREVAAAAALRWLASLGVDSGEEGEGGEGKGEDEGKDEGEGEEKSARERGSHTRVCTSQPLSPPPLP
ncbi:unnamed protein product [Closterium sp. NIES-65]|nr:unnamed protein product [Closterium sp. NIES-65]